MIDNILAAPKTCECGGQLCVGGTGSKIKKFTHLSIKCRNCGAWYGGITRKTRKKGDESK